jgi:hypothetical protein
MAAGVAQSVKRWATATTARVRFSAREFSLLRSIQVSSGVYLAPFLGLMRPDRETYHSPPSSAEAKNISIPPYLICLYVLIEHMDKFTLTFFFSLQPYLYLEINLSSSVVIICTMCFNILKLSIQPSLTAAYLEVKQ